jgi:hypothetical protein
MDTTYPLVVPAELMKEVRAAARRTGLSMADVIRQSTKLGLPRLVEQLSATKLTPFTAAECKECWSQADKEWDKLEGTMTGRRFAPTREDLD